MSQVYYRIVDEQNNFVSKLSFSKCPQGRGQKPKWFYFSETGYIEGAVLYPNETGSILNVLKSLKMWNEKLGFNKVFRIVEVDIGKLKFDGKVLCEEL